MKNLKAENQGPEPQQKEDYGEPLSLSFLNVQEVALYLRVRPSTVYSMAGNRKIPFYRVGRQLRFRKFEIDQWAQGLKQSVIDVKMEASKFIRSAQRRPIIDVNRVVKKAIDEAGKKGYTSRYGKSDRIEGLGKEVKDGAH
jgi:excisionase family DNA binding protein